MYEIVILGDTTKLIKVNISLREKKYFKYKSKYKKTNKYCKLENRTMKNPDRVIQQDDGRIRYEKDYNRVIGTRGEKGHIVIYDTKKDKIITSFPTQE